MTPAARRRWQAAGTVTALTVLLIAISTAPSFAADNGSPYGDLLDPLNVDTPEGVPIDHYELTADESGPIDTVLEFCLSGTFALSRTLVGFSCWVVDWAYRFPVLDKLSAPAQQISDAYQTNIIGPLGITGVFLAWAFVFGLVLAMRGRVARGVGEIMLTLLIAALAATTMVRPDALLGYDGPIRQTQRAALEAASITVNGGDGKDKANDPCDLITGPAQSACRESVGDTATGEDSAAAKKKREAACDMVAGPARDTCLSGERPLAAADISQPITRTLTETLVVQPYMLLEYGQNIPKDSPLYKVHKQLVDPPELEEDPCDLIYGPAKQYCQRDTGVSDAEKAFKKLGDDGKLAASYMKKVTWGRFLGAVLVLIAVLIITLVILSMVLALFAAQFGCVIAAVCGIVVFAWALLPGPNRAVLWKWVGIFASAVVVLFGTAVFIPAFGVAARALLANNQSPMMERLLTLDGLAITALAGHRIMLRKGSGLGRRIADRMRYARIGGSHTMDPNAAATASALSSLNYGNSGGGYGAAHLSFMNRNAGLAAGLRALSDGNGLVGHPGAFLAEASAEGRRALAPIGLGLRATHAALIGPKRPASQPVRLGPDGRPLPPGTTGRTVIDGRTGRIISGGQQDDYTPIGARLEAGLRRTRGGRTLVRTGKVAYHSTVGLPATWTRMRRGTSQLTGELHQELGRQRTHYSRVADAWTADTRDGVRDLTTPVRRTYEAVSEPIDRATRLRTWESTHLDDTGRPRYYGGPPTADGHVPDDIWRQRFPWEPDPSEGHAWPGRRGEGDNRAGDAE
ncbi:YIP1 family protein [Streptomyces sp. TRM68367]|uniref:YIP1 family protein n=1 Tax=Streptomyces sp. TRM68367 TaxID=2758415 RepID=UPI00165A53F7|nr:YIP1 family protein [Streptomyces sp. TRM68367]MBC9729312.1 YIP1 family protein [Streptomyces sp. TRM68367]